MKKQFFIIDTSAILSGRPIHLDNITMVTTPGVSEELSPGGRDYQTFELLQEKGLAIHLPSKASLQLIRTTAQETGDEKRLSSADIEVLALALDINKESSQEATILTDDYSIQNVASTLHIKFQGFSQKEITKRFKWVSRCPGCGRQFQESMSICPVCGTTTRSSPRKKENL
jgi:UPF0271 protein